MAGVTDEELKQMTQEERVTALGMRTEQLTGKSLYVEFDPDAEHSVRRGEDGHYHVDGAMTIRDLNRATDWNLPDEAANTVAGLVIHEAQIIPAVGQVFSFHGFRFEVTGRKDNRVTRLKIRPLA